MMRFSFLLLISLLCNSVLWSQHKKVLHGFTAITLKNYGIALNAFSTVKPKQLSVALFGKAKLYHESIELNNVDSALFYLNLSMTSFNKCILKLSKKEADSYAALGWDIDQMRQLKYQLLASKFNQLKSKGSLEALSQLEVVVEYESLKKEIQRFKDSLWLTHCENNSFACLLGLSLCSPNSYYKPIVQKQLDEVEFLTWVKDGTEDALSSYIVYHPYSVHTRIAEDELYKLYIEQNDTSTLIKFINKYPLNHNIDRVWKAFFQLSSGNYDPVKMQSFIERYPNYPFVASVVEELALFGKDLYPFASVEGLLGYMDENGKEVVPPTFDWVGEYCEGLAIALKGEQYGVIDKQGRSHLPFVYEFLSDFHDGVAIFQQDGLFGVMNRAGIVLVKNIYTDLEWAFGSKLIYDLEGLKGVVSLTGTVESGPKFSSFNAINELLAIVEKEHKFGVINAALIEVIPIEFDELSFADGLFFVEKGGFKGILDEFGKTLLPIEFDEIGNDVNGYRVVRKGQKFSHVSCATWRINQSWYDVYPNSMQFASMVKGQCLIQKKSTYYWMDSINRSSKLFKAFQLNSVDVVLTGVKSKGGKLGFWDRNGVELSPFIFDYVEKLKDGYYIVKQAEKTGVYSREGKEVIPCMYDDITIWDNNLYFLVESGTKKGIFTWSGNVLIPIEFDLIKRYNNTNWVLTKENKLHYFNPSNQHWINQN